MTVEVGADERTRRHAGAGEGEAGSMAPARGHRWATKFVYNAVGIAGLDAPTARITQHVPDDHTRL
jgi:hypothetical protein